ncbi:hypothetical protein PMAC_002125 [Pneumocystis sp. 'macacae']|nr:hypothetical protein PMAC_002125 [Pneumocystis sp. 'macacae']
MILKQFCPFFLNRKYICFSFNHLLNVLYFSNWSLTYKNEIRTLNFTSLDDDLDKRKDMELFKKKETDRDLRNEVEQISTLKPGLKNTQSYVFDEFINKTMQQDSLGIEDTTYHFHAFCSNNNTIITLTNSYYNPVICVTSGMLGFKKSQRGGYEAGYQVCMSIFERMTQKNIRPTQLEIILRGFGKGREAIFKCITGIEGASFRPFIYRITDATRLKFGGVRGRKARRL